MEKVSVALILFMHPLGNKKGGQGGGGGGGGGE